MECTGSNAGLDGLTTAQKRLLITLRHISSNSNEKISPSFVHGSKEVFDGPTDKKNQHGLRWNGWGHADTEFALTPHEELTLTGSRYKLSGKMFPAFATWAAEMMGVDFSQPIAPQEQMKDIPKSILNDSFMRDLKDIETPSMIKFTFDDYSRLFHGHGHTCQEIYKLRYGTFKRLPDVVVFPCDHSQVVRVVELANKHNVCIIPFGGGTNVTKALECPEKERRMIVSLDMKLMNRIKWIDRESKLACIEAGAVGEDLDRRLRAQGYCLGHEPDSFEFSSLGGWIATRASGMKKNLYGNIEDIVVQIELVTPVGTAMRHSLGPRQSVGPDLNEMIIGSEGMFGVITQAIVKLRPIPESTVYDSIVFPDFDHGMAFYKEVSDKGYAPASMRLVDNMQFQFSQALKPAAGSSYEKLLDAMKKYYVTKFKGFDVHSMVAATLVFEGPKDLVERQKKAIYSISKKYFGLIGGEENGKRGFFLTYMIAYLRDFGFNYQLIGESFETAVPWSNAKSLCRQVEARIRSSCQKFGVKEEPFFSFRITQAYETGVCIYFYFAFCYKGLQDPVQIFTNIEEEAREEILECGGSLSHHHGVGKIRKKWVSEAISPTGMEMIKAIKRKVDPKNIFVGTNLID